MPVGRRIVASVRRVMCLGTVDRSSPNVLLRVCDPHRFHIIWHPFCFTQSLIDLYRFYARSHNCEKRLLASSYPSDRLSVRMELDSHWTDFHEI